ncbi:MAG TPA: hypothetical protein VI585_25455, partial [Candidatus Binatia bacterium]
PVTLAFLALGIRLFAGLGENFFNFAFVLSVNFSYTHQTTRLARIIVNGFPKANRRKLGRMCGGIDND